MLSQTQTNNLHKSARLIGEYSSIWAAMEKMDGGGTRLWMGIEVCVTHVALRMLRS